MSAMKAGRNRWFMIFLLTAVFLFLSCRQPVEAGTENHFYLTASTASKLIIEPVAVSYEKGQTIKEALLASEYDIAGLENGFITSIEGMEGNYVMFDDDGGYDLERPASEIQVLAFAEKEVYSPDMVKLIIRMGEYRAMANHVQNYEPASTAYANALKGLRSANAETAKTLLEALNQAILDYENLLTGKKYTVSFSVLQGGTELKNPKLVMADTYGNVTEGMGTSIEVIAGNYQFIVSDGGWNRTEGMLEVSGTDTVSVQLPSGEWFADIKILDVDKNPFSGETDMHEGTFYIPDTVGTIGTYLYANQGPDIPDSAKTTLRTRFVDVEGNDTAETVRSWSSTYTALARLLNTGMEGREFTLEASYTGTDGYRMVQSYGMTVHRVPTLAALDIQDSAGTSLLHGFDSNGLEYSIQAVSSELRILTTTYGEDGYTIVGELDGEPVNDTISLPDNGSSQLTLTVSYNGGQSRDYKITIVRTDAAVVEVKSPGDGITYVIQNQADDIIESSDGIHYALIPGETYHYVTTEKEFFHTKEEFVAVDGMTILPEVPDAKDGMSGFGLYNLSSNYSGNQKTYESDSPFTSENHRYTYIVPDANSSVYVQATVSSGYKAVASYLNQHTIESSSKKPVTKEIDYLYGNERGSATTLGQLVIRGGYSNQLTVSVTKTVNGVEYYQIYEMTLIRSLHLYAMSVSDGVNNLVLENAQGDEVTYDRDITDYYVSVDAAMEQLEIKGTLMNTNTGSSFCGGYSVEINGQIYEDMDSIMIPLDVEEQQEEIPVTVHHKDNSGISITYTIHLKKLEPVEVSFQTNPKNAIVFVINQTTGKPLKQTNGCYLMTPGLMYTYTVSCNGYVAKKVTDYMAPAQNKKLVVNLDEAAKNTGLKQLSAYWPSFRYDKDNNGVVNVKTPITSEDTVLYWANKLGEGYSANACGCPILVDGYLYTYAENKIYKVDTVSGEVVAEGVMDHSSSFAITSPAYADGMIFVGLANGTVQAFNAVTLESLWIFRDELGGQPNCPIVYHNGYLYTGFWLGETSEANFVCISATDEDPSQPMEEKLASWRHTQKGGFYWAGACVRDGFLLVGTDDGESGYINGYGHLLSMDPLSGRVLDDMTLPHTGDVRSSVSYDKETEKYYFTTKGGYFYSVSVNEDGTFPQKALDYLKLYNYADDAQNPAMSTSTPVIYNGRAYVGVSGTAQFTSYSGHNITVLDLRDWEIAYTVRTKGYPQSSGLLTTAYQEETGEVYVYFFDNFMPGKLRMLSDKPGQTSAKLVVQEEGMDAAYVLFTPFGEQAEYSICSPIVDENGTIYFKNDSAHLMAMGSAIEELKITQQPDKRKYKEGQLFDGTGMKVEAVYSNGTTKDVTDYVSWSEQPLTKDDTELQIRFEHVMYQDKDNKAGVSYTAPIAVVYLMIEDGAVYGDVNLDGKITIKDATMLYQYRKKQRVLTDAQKQQADVNRDGIIDDADVTELYRIINGTGGE